MVLTCAAATFAPAICRSAVAPHLDWRTIHTSCCDVHFPAALEPVGRRAAAIVDDSVARASEFLESAPRERIQVVLHDVTDSPNGFAQVVPYDVIDLRAVPPSGDSDLAVTDEYLRLLIQHEILHVVHMDTFAGLPAVVNVVLGKVWPPNLIQPRFLVEGLATYAETRFTAGGRLRSTLFRSEVLLGALAGDLWSLDDLANFSRRNPGGGAAYAYGAAFIEWLSVKYGAHIWSAIAHDYGESPIPWAVQRSIEAATGRDVDDDYQLFLDDVRAAAADLRARAEQRGGPTRARRLTRSGGEVGSFRFGAGGELFVSVDPPDGPAGVYVLRGLPSATPTLEPIVRTNEAADLALVGGELMFTQGEISRGWYNFGDLWHLERGALRRVTREARIDHPSAVPGSRSVVVEHRSAIESALLAVDVDTGKMRDIVRSDEGHLWYTPEVSPDGRAVVASRWMPGGARDLVEIDLATGEMTLLTHDGAQDLDPSYTPDGAQVLFASDREGTFCIYAIERSTRVVRRVVDSLGVARRPRATPDGSAVVYVDTHLEGQDLYAAPLQLDSAAIAGAPPPPPSARALTTPSDAAIERYDPLPTLRPRYWLPVLATDPLGGPALGAVVVGDDAAGLFSWSAQATWGTSIERPRVSSTWRFNNLELPLLLTGEWRTDVSSALRQTDGIPDVQQETVLRGAGILQLPILRQQRHVHSFGLGYTRELHLVENPLTSPPDARAPVYPPSGNVGAVTFDWSYAGIESYRDSVSLERGFTSFLRLRHANRMLLSELDLTELFVDVRTFEPIPGLGGHVLGLYLSGAAAFGEPFRRARYVLGGIADRDLTRDLLEGTRSAGGLLRGYETAAVVGDAFVLSTIEYRLPLLDGERGISSLPFFVERLHAAAFVDLGHAFTGAPDVREFRAGIGAELRLSLVLGYYGYFLVRAGCARGVSAGGVDQPYIVLGVPY